MEGGHDVPEAVVRRRFDRSIRNFLQHYRPLGDSWMLFDNAAATPAVIAFEKQWKPPYNESRDLRIADCSLRETMTKPPANVLELPLEERAEMALKAAVEKVIVEHARRGLRLYIWRNGGVVEVPPDELRVESVRLQAESI